MTRVNLRMRRDLFLFSPRRWALGACGKGSVILKPDLIRGHHYIFLGDRVTIREHSRIEAIQLPGRPAPRLEIADGVCAELYLHIACAERVSIGRSVLIAGRVFITDHDHGLGQLNAPVVRQPLETAPTTIGDYVWLGEGVVILKGVTIGNNAVVGANSVVTKSVPEGAIVAGSPAREIGNRMAVAKASG